MNDLKNRKIFDLTYTNPDFHEEMIFFPAEMVFVNEPDFIERYKLNAKYRDFKLVTKEGLPQGFPINNLEYDENGYATLISIRAMHRILYQDINTNTYHFLMNDTLKRKLLDYDKNHFGFLNGLLSRYPYTTSAFHARIDIKGVEEVATTTIDYIEQVHGLDNKPGFLVYAHDSENKDNYTLYLDGEFVQNLHILYKDD